MSREQHTPQDVFIAILFSPPNIEDNAFYNAFAAPQLLVERKYIGLFLFLTLNA